MLFLFSITIQVSAKEYRVCTVNIPNAMTENGKGPQPFLDFYKQVIKRYTEKFQHTFKLQFAPAKRCETLFIEKKVDIVWPFIISSELERIKPAGYKEIPLYSMPIIMGGYYIYTRKDAPKIDSVEQLFGKKIVGPRGYGMPAGLVKNPKVSIVYVNKNPQVPRLIESGRVYAGVVQTGWVENLKSEGLLKNLHRGKMIDLWGGSFTFQFSQEGASLANAFTNIILELIGQGKYDGIVNKAPYSIPYYKK